MQPIKNYNPFLQGLIQAIYFASSWSFCSFFLNITIKHKYQAIFAKHSTREIISTVSID
jgi:hypothetical protein